MIDFTSMNIRIWSRLGSCGAFGQAALVLPEVEPRTVILTADLCFPVWNVLRGSILTDYTT